MKVFYNGDAPDITLSAGPAGHLPAAECPEEWFEEDGTTPKQFAVRFQGGEANVEDSLGRYLCKQKIARSTKVLFPGQANRPLLAA